MRAPLLLLLLLSTAAPHALAGILTGATVNVEFTWSGMPATTICSPSSCTQNLADPVYATSLTPAWGSFDSQLTINVPAASSAYSGSGVSPAGGFQVAITESGLINFSPFGTISTLQGLALGASGTLKLTTTGGGPSFAGLDISLFSGVAGCGITASGPTIAEPNTMTFTIPNSFTCTAASFQVTNPICFPASSTLRRLASNGEAWETVAMPDLRVGDTVECLAREPVFGRNNAASAAYGRLQRCSVYGYKKALPAATMTAPYVRITYEPLANTPGGTVAMSANHHLLDPLTGQARQAGSLKAGDRVLRTTPSGALVAAKVIDVASVQEGGAYVPLLSGGGLPVVDGVVAYPSSGDSDVGLDAKHWGQHYLHAPVWQPLLDTADDNGDKATPEGRSLAELGAQAPVAAFTKRWHAVRKAAAREGRVTCDWAGVAAEMHAAITKQGKRYTEAEALAVLDRHHHVAVPGVAVA